MCFDHDYDWTASVWNETVGPADKPCRCLECGRDIAVGEVRRHVFAQEHEECQRGEECSEHFDPAHVCAPGGEGCHFGEEDEFDQCDECLVVRKVIRAVEEVSGCK